MNSQVTLPDDTGTDLHDPALMAKAQAGDAEAFCILASACQTRLYRQAMGLCGEPQTAEDLVAETLSEAWRSLPRFDASCRFTTWLYAILLHRHLKQLRRRRARPMSLASLPEAEARERLDALQAAPAQGASAYQRLAEAERAAQWQRLIQDLPPAQGDVLRLRFFQSASLAEIAAALDIPLGTVKSRLHQALTTLRKLQAVMNLLEPGRDE